MIKQPLKSVLQHDFFYEKLRSINTFISEKKRYLQTRKIIYNSLHSVVKHQKHYKY